METYKIKGGKYGIHIWTMLGICGVWIVPADWRRMCKMCIRDSTYAVEAMEPIIQQYKPRLVIVDFMQFIKTNRKFLNRRNEIDYISGELKRIARQNDCHIMIPVSYTHLFNPFKPYDPAI